MDKKVVKRSLVSYIGLFIVILGIFYFMNVLNTKVNDLTYSEFLKQLEKDTVTELTITPNSTQSIYSLTGKLEDYNENEEYNNMSAFLSPCIHLDDRTDHQHACSGRSDTTGQHCSKGQKTHIDPWRTCQVSR